MLLLHGCIYAKPSIYLIYLSIYLSSPRYNLFGPHTATCIHVFRVDGFSLDNQLVCSFLKKDTIPTHSFPHSALVLCIRLRPCGLFSIQFGMFIGIYFEIILTIIFRIHLYKYNIVLIFLTVTLLFITAK